MNASVMRATGYALVAGPAIFFVDNLLHPEEFGRSNEAAQLAAIAESPERWQAAHLIGFASLIVFVVAILGLSAIVARTDRRTAVIAGGAALVGILGFAWAFAIDGFAWGVLGEVSARSDIDAATMEAAFGELQQSGWAFPYYLLGIGWILGIPYLAQGALRAGALELRPAVLLGLGAVAVGLEGVFADNTYFILSSALLLIGGADAAMSLFRHSRAETTA